MAVRSSPKYCTHMSRSKRDLLMTSMELKDASAGSANMVGQARSNRHIFAFRY